MTLNKDVINIVFITDEHYLMPTTVTITSLKINRDKFSNYSIFVITTDLSEESKQKLLSLSEEGFEIILREETLPDSLLKMKQVRGRVRPAAMMKFYLPEIFQHLPKILYLDSDIIIQKDLKPLFDIDISDCYAAVVDDIMSVNGKEYHLKWLNFRENAYFNSGVMLLNLDRMRKDNIPFQLFDYRRYGLNRFTDQDAFNVIFKGDVKYISPYYNLLTCFFEWESVDFLRDFYHEDFPYDPEERYRKATILHFGDTQKPWKYDIGYLSELYKSYYIKSPYASQPLHLEKWEGQRNNAVLSSMEAINHTSIISVIIPILSDKSDIRKCLDSVLSQDYSDLEINCIVSETDHMHLQILEAYSKTDERIKIIMSDVSTYAGMINSTLNHSGGKYVAIISTKNYILPNMFTKLVKTAEEKQLDFIKTDYFVSKKSESEDKDQLVYRRIIRTEDLPYNQVIDPNENGFSFETGNEPGAGLYNLEFLRANNIYFNESELCKYPEIGFWFQTLCKGHRALFLNEPYLSCTYDSQKYLNGNAIFEEFHFIRSELKKSPTLEKRFTALSLYYLYREWKKNRDYFEEDEKLSSYQQISGIFQNINLYEIPYQTLFSLSETEEILRIIQSPDDEYYCNSKITYDFIWLLPPDRYPGYLKRVFYEKTGETLNLEKPETFNQKIQWLKLYYETPDVKRLSDQLFVRDWVKNRIGDAYLTPIYRTFDLDDEIDFSEIPESFTLGINFSSDNILSVRDKNNFTQQQYKEILNRWMKKGRTAVKNMELMVTDIHPKLFIETFLSPDVPEFSFFCFNGIHKLTQIRYNKGTEDCYYQIFDLKQQVVASSDPGSAGFPVAIPKQYGEMIKLAEKTACDFPFVSVSFQIENDQISFTGMSFAPESGFIHWNEPLLDIYYGKILKLPNDKTSLPEKSFAELGIPNAISREISANKDVWDTLKDETRDKEDLIIKKYSLLKEFDRKERMIREKETRIQTLTSEINTLKDEKREKETRIQTLTSEIIAVYSSSSWKIGQIIVQPLHMIKTLYHKLKSFK
ncbi:glycosyltransferase [Methanobrevibacter sp.]|uniref:glycosyltransferase n=1 Tax=Methanobrevibacter sp. TaxID=66852 RepID=UPI00388F5832